MRGVGLGYGGCGYLETFSFPPAAWMSFTNWLFLNQKIRSSSLMGERDVLAVTAPH